MIASSLAPPAAPSAQRARVEAERPHAAATHRTTGLALRIALLAVAGVLIIAAVVRVTFAGRARGWLGYSFPGVSPHTNVAAGIFAHNSRAILGVFGLLLIAQIASRRPGGPSRTQRGILVAGELTLAGVILANVLVVGAGLGAYGVRMVRADLPHGPVELAAFTLALALYAQGRRYALPAAHLAKIMVASVALLALAAALETFVNV